MTKSPKHLEPRGRKLQVQVNSKVAKFVEDHDGPNNVLMVYKAGHGESGTHSGELELFGFVLSTAAHLMSALLRVLSPHPDLSKRPQGQRSTPVQRRLDRLVWNKTEGGLKDAEATILEIFDW